MNKKILHFINWLFVLAIFMPFNPLLGQCDSQVIPSNNQLITYKNRVNRCEGFYRARVGAPIIEVVGFMKGNFRFRPERNEEIYVSLANFSPVETHIRAVGIPVDLYYRMDAMVAGNERLNWPVGEVLIRDNRTSIFKNIGILGYITKGQKKVFVPVSTSSKLVALDTSQTKKVVLRTSSKLSIIMWKLSTESEFKVLKKGNIKAGRPLQIKLNKELQGEHIVQIKAKEEGANNFNVNLEFHIQL